MRPVLLGLALGALALGGCAGESGDGGESPDGRAQEEQQPAQTPDCRLAPGVAVAALEQSVTVRGEDKLKHARSVRVTDAPEPPLNGLKGGAYVVSGQLVAPGVEASTLSWVVGRGMHNTGGGLALPADEVTRKISALGTRASPGSPAARYIAAVRRTKAYKQSRACAEGLP